jgi:hypothetical protein
MACADHRPAPGDTAVFGWTPRHRRCARPGGAVHRRHHPDRGATGRGPLVDEFVLAFVAAALLLALTAVVSLVLFRDKGRGQQMNVMELQKAEL